jgi:hypothetical protein
MTHPKPWTIEFRAKYRRGWTNLFHDWSVWKRYETEARRDEALKTRMKDRYFEYRAGQVCNT